MRGAVTPMVVPFLPPLPAATSLAVNGLTLARLVTTLGTVAMTADLDGGEAMAVFRDRALVVATARRGESVITGQAALDAIGAAPVERLRLHEIPLELAGLIGAYFLPTVVDGLPAAAVVPELFLRSLARPGQVACVIVQTAGDFGLVFLGGRETLMAYTRSRGEIGGMERLAGLLDQPDALLGARAGAATAAPLPALPRPTVSVQAVAPPPGPRAAAPPPQQPTAPPPRVNAPMPQEPTAPPPRVTAPRPQQPAMPPPRVSAPPPQQLAAAPPLVAAPRQQQPAAPPPVVTSVPAAPAPQHAPQSDALTAFIRATAGAEDGGAPPAGRAAPPPPASSPAAEDGGMELMDAVIAEARSVLGRNSARVEDVLTSVEPTPQAIEAAVRALRDRGVRLIRPEKLDEAVERILAVLRDRDLSRRT